MNYMRFDLEAMKADLAGVTVHTTSKDTIEDRSTGMEDTSIEAITTGLVRCPDYSTRSVTLYAKSESGVPMCGDSFFERKVPTCSWLQLIAPFHVSIRSCRLTRELTAIDWRVSDKHVRCCCIERYFLCSCWTSLLVAKRKIWYCVRHNCYLQGKLYVYIWKTDFTFVGNF